MTYQRRPGRHLRRRFCCRGIETRLAARIRWIWDVQPVPKDYVWRLMTNLLGGGDAMTPHYSGTTLDAQAPYAQGTKEVLVNCFTGKPANIIVGLGKHE